MFLQNGSQFLFKVKVSTAPIRWPSVIEPPFLYLSSADKYKWSYLQEIWTEIPVLYKQWVKMETGGVANKDYFQAVIWIAWQIAYKQLFSINSNQRKTQISRRKNEIISTFEILFNINISLWAMALCSRPLHRKDRHCCQVLLQGLVSAGLQLVLRKTRKFSAARATTKSLPLHWDDPSSPSHTFLQLS